MPLKVTSRSRSCTAWGNSLQIIALDELAHGHAVVEARHRDQQPRPEGAGGFDVEVPDPRPEGAKQAPVLICGQKRGKVGRLVHVLDGFPQILLETPEPLPGQTGHPRGGQKILPGLDPLAPEMGLAPRPHPGQVDEGAF